MEGEGGRWRGLCSDIRGMEGGEVRGDGEGEGGEVGMGRGGGFFLTGRVCQIGFTWGWERWGMVGLGMGNEELPLVYPVVDSQA